MATLNMVTKIDKVGRIQIPKNIRKAIDVELDTNVVLKVENNTLLIQSYSELGKCVFCNSNTDIKEFSGKAVCDKCIKKLTDKKNKS